MVYFLRSVSMVLFFLATFGPPVLSAQFSPAPAGGPALKTTYIRLGDNANALLIERETPDPLRSRIAVLVTHPEHINNFNYYTALALARRGYRAMTLNYYGPETSYYEFLQPIAAAMAALRTVPGVEKIVLTGHSTGGPELTSYEDVAENGFAACQGAERIYKCDGKGPDRLPREPLQRADGLMLIDSNAGAPERTIALNPAVDPHFARVANPDLDMFSPTNGFDPATRSATYSKNFLDRFFPAQGAKANLVIDQALFRLSLIDKGEGEYKDDEPFVVAGASVQVNGARPELADLRLLAHSHAPHMLLKADGTRPVQIVPQVYAPAARPDQEDSLALTTLNVTVRHYLSFQALRVTSAYRENADTITGVVWRSTANSLQGNIQGIHVPTLVMSGTCAAHLVLLETAFDLSPAADKTMVGVEGANHGMLPCRPEFGDTFQRAFDFADEWLLHLGRFLL